MPSISQRPFAVLDGQQFSIAVDEITTRFTDSAPSEAKKLHASVAVPLQKAVKGNAKPRLIAHGQAHHPKDADVFVVQLGSKSFPFVVSKSWNETEIRILEPIDTDKVDPGAIRSRGLRGIFTAKKGAKWSKIDHIAVKRGRGQATNVQIKGMVAKDVPYAWALFETVSGLLRQAETSAIRSNKAARKADQESFEKVEFGSVQSVAATPIADILLNNKSRGAISGPPSGVAHDLAGVQAWKGRAVAVTTQRDSKVPAKVWIQDRDGGDSVWLEINPPANTEGFPTRGAAMQIIGDTLHVVGSIGKDGSASAAHFTYDLHRGVRSDFGPGAWNRRADMEDARGFCVLAQTEDAPFAVGGLAGYYLKGADEPKNAKKKVHVRKGATALDRGSWRRRDPAPGEVTGAHSVSDGRVVVVAPGNNLDGKVFVYDATDAWFVLPPLPKEVGLGQVFLQGETLTYSGGYNQDGSPSKDIYTLDLGDLTAKWEHVGESDLVAGSARVVRSDKRWMSLMLKPEASWFYFVD